MSLRELVVEKAVVEESCCGGELLWRRVVVEESCCGGELLLRKVVVDCAAKRYCGFGKKLCGFLLSQLLLVYAFWRAQGTP